MALGRRGLLLAGATSLLASGARALGGSRAAHGSGGLAFPPPLGPGSHLVAFNPASRLERPAPWLDRLRLRIEAEGWQLLVPEQVFGHWRWFSQTDERRSRDLMSLWSDPQVLGILQVGGGWGSSRLLEAGWSVPRRPLWNVGFSDASALLLAQWAAGLGGGVHAGLGGSAADGQRLMSLLAGRPVAPLQGRAGRTGRAEGPLVVTNLTVATHLIGTPWLPDLTGAVLVLEDVGEAPYRVDRLLTQWRASGRLRGLAGVALGRFSWTPEDVQPGDLSMEEVLLDRLGDLGIPLVLDLPVGHGQPNAALPMGRTARLDGGAGTLSLL
ncbi:LD-carboxypeptidase [Cyanobium sp. ATX 6F1]|uniref:S66 peptidase family protein n=1 Tax=Cyanobium sp. ATX 6F1 TaxID=2823702 RepID=UPI0020CFC94A|nr:LD-carboxypeptidase [Cyanobium sp. ATX 6F1]MCP9916106.1 LD-carboxypeptidase [Cyanobium sp. ATX 6F1]